MSFDLAKDYSDIGAIKGYFPELDYRNRDYEPFKDQFEVPDDQKEHFCDRCVRYYKNLYNKGITSEYCNDRNTVKEDGTQNPVPFFLPICYGDSSKRSDEIAPEQFEDAEDYYQASIILDPVRWAEATFNWKARWYQRDFIRCTSQRKSIRAGRRIGKTEGMAIYILWRMWTNSNFQVLIIAPYQPQVKKLFEMMRLFIQLGGLDTKTNRESPYEQITFNNGSTVRGFSSGARTGAKSDKIRGQDAHEIVMDEADYLADEDLEVISAIMASRPEVGLTVTSTPTGVRKKLHSWCTDKNQRFKEFWFVSAESPSWTRKAEDYFRANYSEGGYSREFLAEFGTEMIGVFRTKDIEGALRNYTYQECIPTTDCKYVIGVDWNKNTGTHILVVEQRYDPRFGAIYRPVDKQIIRRAEFQQHSAVQAIMKLDRKWRPAFIYVDAGYGAVQVEMLQKYDKDHPQEKTNYRKRVVPVEMGGNTIIKNPVTGADEKKPTKPLFVNLLAAQLEQNRLELPRVEDTETRILPEEIEVIDIGLVQQMREFRVTKYSPQGRPSYSQDYEHTLTALMCAVGGFVLKFSDMNRVNHRHDVRALGSPAIKGKVDGRKKKLAEMARRERLKPQDRTESMGRAVKIESTPDEPDPGYKFVGTDKDKQPQGSISSQFDSKRVRDEMALANSGKLPIRALRRRKSNVTRRHGRNSGYRRKSF